MAVLVTERWSERNFTYAAGGVRTTRVFDVTGVSSLRAAIGAVESFDVSTLYNRPHPQAPFCWVDNQTGDPAGFSVWKVVISYASTPAGRHFNPGNPMQEPVVWNVDWNYLCQGADSDATGNPILNTAGDAFADNAPAETLNGFFVGDRIEAIYDAGQAVTFANAVNTQTVTINRTWTFHPGQLCCRTITPVTPITSASDYTTCRYRLEGRKGLRKDSDEMWDAFKLRILNQGTRAWVTDSGSPVLGPLAELINGQLSLISQPALLQANGIPYRSNYVVAKPNGGWGAPIANPNGLPTGAVVENTGVATFIKYFPRGTQLRDLTELRL